MDDLRGILLGVAILAALAWIGARIAASRRVPPGDDQT